MAGGRLFEQSVVTTIADGTFRLASGRPGQATENIEHDDYVDYLAEELLNLAGGGSTPVIVQIGTWNMDTTPSVTAAWALPASNEIVSISAVIYADSGDVYNIDHIDGLPAAANVSGGISYDDSLNQFDLSRTNLGFFDAAGFSAAGNRGFIIVRYKPV
jgi:hypothetical protein